MSSQIAMTKDSPFPPMEKGKLRVYSMRFCPYAQRSRIILEHYKVPFETVNINLGSKPTWFFDKNPNGAVPAYEKDGEVLYESGVLCDFFEQVYGTGELYPQDHYQKAKAKILMESASKYTGPYYKLFFAKPGDAHLKESAEAFHKGLDFFEQRLESTFFNGSSVGMVDYFLWPHIERVAGMGLSLNLELMPEERFPKLSAWASAMKSTPGVEKTLFSDADHKAFIDSISPGGKANFDYGL